MGTPSLRLRLVFEDRSILTKTQRSDGLNHSWLLLKLQQHRTISDVCTHVLHIFKLHRSCPNGILLSMEGFTLPPFESTEILKDKEIICVKKKGGTTPDAGNLLDEAEDDVLEPEDNDLLLLENNKFDKAGEYQSSEEVDEEQSQDEELPEEFVSKKRKASTNLSNLKKKKRCVGVLDDDEDEAETEEIENVNNDASHPMKVTSKETNFKASTSNKKVKSSSIVKWNDELQENVEVNQVSNDPGAKKVPSRSSRRKKAKRRLKKEYAKIAKKKPQAYSKPEVTKPKNDESNGQPKGLLYWKQASKKPVQNGDVGPVVTKPRHIRFEPLDEDQTANQTGVSNETLKWNGSSSKKKGKKCGREKFSNFRRDDSRRINKESFKTLFKDSQVPVIDINDFDKLPPCSEPKEGDVIAYRLLELNSSWIPEFSSFRVGRIAYYDAKDIVLIPVPQYPIVSEKMNDNGPNDSLYEEDGSLQINYSALVDVRNIMQHDPNAMETVNNGLNQTPPSKDGAQNLVYNTDANNINVPKDTGEVTPWDCLNSKNTEMPKPIHSIETVNNGLNQTPPSKDAAEKLVSNTDDNVIDISKDTEGEANPWDCFNSKNTEMPEPNHSEQNICSYGGAGPSTSTGPDANKAESSGAKEGQTGDSFDPWLAAKKPDPFQENNASWSETKKSPTENDCENGSLWGRPWSAFVVSRSSSVIQPDKENDWRAGSSRGSGKPWSRGAPRGRGRGYTRGRGRGRHG